jgi:hypothetical protein
MYNKMGGVEEGNQNIVDHITNSLGSLRSLTNPSITLENDGQGKGLRVQNMQETISENPD